MHNQRYRTGFVIVDVFMFTKDRFQNVNARIQNLKAQLEQLQHYRPVAFCLGQLRAAGFSTMSAFLILSTAACRVERDAA